MLHLEFISSQEIEEFWILNALYLIAKINIADKNFQDVKKVVTKLKKREEVDDDDDMI